METILIMIIWLMTACFLAFKWTKAWEEEDNENVDIVAIWFSSLFFTPIVLVVVIVRQVIINDWT